jgi:hypothetical protein
LKTCRFGFIAGFYLALVSCDPDRDAGHGNKGIRVRGTSLSVFDLVVSCSSFTQRTEKPLFFNENFKLD